MSIKILRPALDPERPGQTLTILDPVTHRYLASEGEAVEMSNYWVNRLNDGDVIEGAAPVILPEYEVNSDAN